MRKIEEKYSQDIAVIGVHSGKYIAERETARIREASLRYDIRHPVVNDRQFRIWRAYAVRAWPTLAVIDRHGYVVGAHAGEFTAEMLTPLLDALVSMTDESGGSPIAHSAEPPAITPKYLRYPGKVAVRDRRLAIADTGNHRVLIGSLVDAGKFRVEREVSLFRDPTKPQVTGFHSPQGLAFAGEELIVADSGTHCLVGVDIQTGSARVIAGTGAQLRTRGDRDAGALSSPWDVVVVGHTAYVAMAGIHQLWRIDIASGEASIHAGTGGEDIADGNQADALLAQPMAITTDGERIYFADAESSAIRWCDVNTKGEVGTIVGTGLFDFGDVDGIGDKVRMQHQQGVALGTGGRLLVADSYNDALKWLDIEKREAVTWLRGLHEPGGVAIGGGHAYVADTNAHRIMVANLSTAELSELQISS